jgi:hypothetical protein
LCCPCGAGTGLRQAGRRPVAVRATELPANRAPYGPSSHLWRRARLACRNNAKPCEGGLSRVARPSGSGPEPSFGRSKLRPGSGHSMTLPAALQPAVDRGILSPSGAGTTRSGMPEGQSPEPAEIPRDVFISYDSQDTVVANKLVETLERRGLRCWKPPETLEPEPSTPMPLFGLSRAQRLSCWCYLGTLSPPHM